MSSAKHALIFKERYPEAEAYLFYENICGSGKGFQEFQRHYICGNNLARRRFQLFGHLLEYIGIEAERFALHWISASEGSKFARIMTETTETIRALGPNKLRDIT